MLSFNRRHSAETAVDQVPEHRADAEHAAAPDLDTVLAAEGLPPSENNDVSEDVDFDSAIAEVLMTLAADRGTADARPPADDRQAPAASAAHADSDDDRDDDSGFDDDGDSADEDGDADDAVPDPEAVLAAEAATFRLLGELERLWHRAA
jgi:hypothetical protein